MKNQIVTLSFVAFFFFTNVFAQKLETTPTQQTPKISGTWVMDQKQSEVSAFGGNLNMSSPNCVFEVTIEQIDFELKIKRKSECNSKSDSKKPVITEGNYSYFVDGRGETNTSVILNKPIESKTKWNKDTLTIEEFSQTAKSDKKTLSRLIEYKLSKDSENLMVVIKNFGTGTYGSVPNTSKDVYKRRK
jgi:hypothetical protein